MSDVDRLDQTLRPLSKSVGQYVVSQTDNKGRHRFEVSHDDGTDRVYWVPMYGVGVVLLHRYDDVTAWEGTREATQDLFASIAEAFVDEHGDPYGGDSIPPSYTYSPDRDGQIGLDVPSRWYSGRLPARI